MRWTFLFVASVGYLGLALSGCERHELEKTGVLHMEHGKSHDGHEAGGAHAEEHPADDHGKSHSKEEHPAGETHVDVKKDGKAEKPKAPEKVEEPRETGL